MALVIDGHSFFKETEIKPVFNPPSDKKNSESELNNKNNKMSEIKNSCSSESPSIAEGEGNYLSYDLFNINPTLPKKNYQHLLEDINKSDFDDIWNAVVINIVGALKDKKP